MDALCYGGLQRFCNGLLCAVERGTAKLATDRPGDTVQHQDPIEAAALA